VGAVHASRFVMTDVVELYDYDVLRRIGDATMFVVRVSEPTLVLGSSQSTAMLHLGRLGAIPLRRRRGGGGMVLLQPDDLWIDWWIPVDDPRWRFDVRESSVAVGRWWRDELASRLSAVVELHEGPLEGDAEHRVVCFAGRGPGEVFVDGRKAVGLTQWRVREGMFVSTVLPAHDSRSVLDLLREVPAGLESALAHQTLTSLALDADELEVGLRDRSGPWIVRPLFLSA
jgi:lipoate---protein ligase